jgi:hypothetical protein
MKKVLWCVVVWLVGGVLGLAQTPDENAGKEEHPQVKQHKPAKAARPPVSGRSRTITVDEEAVQQIYCWPGYSTEINLPASEEIKNFGQGDGGWVMVCGQSPVADAGAKNICHVKPKYKDEASNLNVITGAGTYSFELVPATKDHPVDLKVFVTRAQRTLIAANGGFAVATVPKSELLACYESDHQHQRELQGELAEANLKIKALIDPREVRYSDYEIKHFPLGARPEETIFHTAERTYIRIKGNPAVFETDEKGKSVQVKAVCSDGLCMVPKVLERGYFTAGIAQKHIKFERKKKGQEHHG